MVIIPTLNEQQIKLTRHHCTTGIEKQNASLAMSGWKQFQYKTQFLWWYFGINRPSRYSAVGIATRYGLEGPGIESRWGDEIFRIRPDWPWYPPRILYNVYRVSFQGVKRPRRGVDHPSASSAEVKDRVELYLYSPSGLSWPVLGWTLTLLFTRLSVTGRESDVGQPVASYVLGCGSSHRVSPESPDTRCLTTETLHIR